MNAIPSSFSNSAPPSLLDAETTSMRWSALGGAGNVVAALARKHPEENSVELREFTVLLQDCPTWKRELVERGVADLAAIMQPGMETLLSVNARGGDVLPAANALYQEFLTARLAIIALLSAVEEN
jgi:hypothetical protein